MARPDVQTFTEDRIDEMIEVLARARADDKHEKRMTRDEARQHTVLDPDFDPEGAWLAIMGEETVGFGSALVEKTRIEAGRDDAWVEFDVVPEHEWNGIEQTLLDQALGYLRLRGVGKAMTRVLAVDEKRKAFLLSNSFEEVYRIYTLVRRGRERVPEPLVPKSYRLERWDLLDCSDQQLTAVTEALNSSFTDHINYAPERPERILNMRDCKGDPFAITVALQGDDIAGLAWSEYSQDYNKQKHLNVGWVVVIGVCPPHRRIGLGKALLSDGIRWILDKGADTVYLGAFAKNEKALGLYRAFGFEKERESVLYTRPLRT
jgi:GNAT superfamily N-acetyltransferase